VKKLMGAAVFVVLLVFLAGCSRRAGSSPPVLVDNFSRSSIIEESLPTFGEGILSFSPPENLEYARFNQEVRSLRYDWQTDQNFRSLRQEDNGFIIDLVHPISTNQAFNDFAAAKISEFVDAFVSQNSRGSFYARPHTHAYNGGVLGLLVDLRFYGDLDGFVARRHVTNFDLDEGESIKPCELFAPDADFREVFYQLAYAAGFELTGNEYFTFDYDYIYLHIYTGKAGEPYAVLALPFCEFEELWVGITPAPRVAFTFDDGPHYRFTPMLLDWMEKRGKFGTFFLLGASAYENPEIVARMHNAGHQIGNHSYSHALLTALEPHQILHEIAHTNQIIYNITGYRPTLLRPPFGGVNQRVQDVAYEAGKSVVLWSVDPRDWYYLNAIMVRDHIISRARDGSVILVHDIHESSILGTKMAMEHLAAQGFSFVTVNELYRRAGVGLYTGTIHRSIYRDGFAVLR